MNPPMEEPSHLPFIIFTVKEQTYCVNSEHIVSIDLLPKLQPIPNMSACITGMFSRLGKIYHMFDLRTAFGFPSVEQEIQTFKTMIEQRRQDHRNWVNTLQTSVSNGTPFPLATDPHCCAFGKWFYGLWNSEHVSQTVNFVLGKIESPHRRLHESALQMIDGYHDPDRVMQTIQEEYMPALMGLLDEMVHTFAAEMQRKMVLVVDDGHMRAGLAVDEVISVEHLEIVSYDCGPLANVQRNCFSCVRRSAKLKDSLILEIDIQKLLVPFQYALDPNP